MDIDVVKDVNIEIKAYMYLYVDPWKVRGHEHRHGRGRGLTVIGVKEVNVAMNTKPKRLKP